MPTASPLAVGTRGTVGSLVRREIEYFRRLELDKQSGSSKRLEKQSIDASHGNGSHRLRSNTLGYLFMMGSRRKKRSNNGGSSFLPSICSAVEVTDRSYKLDGISGFSYRNLRQVMEEDLDI
ncbi:hypothetical protein Nepgr_032115 [Nepenthes gracilis]|uniref:Uncharacterized protein n=1 Tax=Nepenthes gracilis TaxID=150966 RepID=A0AAD3TK83_NEPGR|nr:hypothetical protein Nepgr_032115 [Nepenthes gracilis]